MVRMLRYLGRICYTAEGHTIHVAAKYELQNLVFHILQVCMLLHVKRRSFPFVT